MKDLSTNLDSRMINKYNPIKAKELLWISINCLIKLILLYWQKTVGFIRDILPKKILNHVRWMVAKILFIQVDYATHITYEKDLARTWPLQLDIIGKKKARKNVANAGPQLEQKEVGVFAKLITINAAERSLGVSALKKWAASVQNAAVFSRHTCMIFITETRLKKKMQLEIISIIGQLKEWQKKLSNVTCYAPIAIG